MRRLLIDPGHGGYDPGAVATHMGTEYEESQICLDVAWKLREILEKTGMGIEVHMTRTSDVYISPNARANLNAQLESNIFLSIHCNASSSPAATGTETIFRDEDDLVFATVIHSKLTQALKLRDRGLKSDVLTLNRKLAVLRSTPEPACLVELGFITNRGDLNSLLNTNLVASALADGVKAWYANA